MLRLISPATWRKQGGFSVDRSSPLNSAAQQRAHSSVWSELPAHNRLVPGSNPGGPIEGVRKRIRE